MGGLMSGKLEADITPVSTMSGGQQRMSNALLGYTAQNLFGTNGVNGTLQNPNVYPGMRAAPASPLQQQSFAMASRSPYLSGQTYGNANAIMGQLAQPTENLFQPVIDATMNTWQQQMAPDIMSRFGGMDTAGSGGALAGVSREGGNLMQQLAGQLSQMKLQGMGQQAGALPAMQSWAGYPMDQATAMANLGTQQRGIGQEYLTGEQQKWTEAQPYANPMLAYATQLLPQSGQQVENVVAQKQRSIFDMIGGLFG